MIENRNKIKRRGAALLVVLFVVMAITILSLGFLSRSDVELACSENMILRTQMDYLAESGLEHARGLILNPQEVDTEFWTGDVRQQLVAGSDDYYDVNVVKLGECNYQITCEAYREKNGEKNGRSSLVAELRLDPYIAFRTGRQWTSELQTTINGDVYCEGNLKGVGDINGDGFAQADITATNVEGQKNKYVAEAPVDWPGLEVSDFSSNYQIGPFVYSVGSIDVNELDNVTLGPTAGNPAGVYYRDGSLKIESNVVVNGTLVVKDDLVIIDSSNTITAAKNFPALIVGRELQLNETAGLTAEGLVQVKKEVEVENVSGANLTVLGSLFIKDEDMYFDDGASTLVSVNVTASPNKAAIQIWDGGSVTRWSPAGGAFFRSIERE